jgi:hypothetical protein
MQDAVVRLCQAMLINMWTPSSQGLHTAHAYFLHQQSWRRSDNYLMTLFQEVIPASSLQAPAKICVVIISTCDHHRLHKRQRDREWVSGAFYNRAVKPHVELPAISVDQSSVTWSQCDCEGDEDTLLCCVSWRGNVGGTQHCFCFRQ